MMATVPSAIPQHPPVKQVGAFNAPRSRNFPQVQPAQVSKTDPFYGNEKIARLCGRFISHLFTCPELPPSSTQSQQKLPHFIAYALHRTKLHSSVTFACLILLQRLKGRFPTARGSSGHRLFISAFMIASKVICDDTYSNKSWGIVAQGMFNLREINQMEREMCNYLEWELNVDSSMLANFEHRVTLDFSEGRPSYPNYEIAMVSKRAAKAAASSSATPMPDPDPTTSPIPFGRTDKGAPTPPSWASPQTPSPCHSNTTSPASSASPPTPVGMEDYSAKIQGQDASPNLRMMKFALPEIHPLKTQMFANVHVSRW